MSFLTVPATNTGDKYRASQHNTYVKDNLAELWKYTTAGDITYATSATQITRMGISANKYVGISTSSAPYYKSGLGAVAMQIKMVEDSTDVTLGASAKFYAPTSINGLYLASISAYVTTAGSGGKTVVDVRNLTSYVGEQFNRLYIVPEIESGATSASGRSFSYPFATNDLIYVFVGLVSTTAPKGLQVFLIFS